MALVTTKYVNPQVNNRIELGVDTKFQWRPVPHIYNYEANCDDGTVRRANDWKIACTLDPVAGEVLVPVCFEGDTYWLARRYFVALAHLDRPRQILTSDFAFLFDVARCNDDRLDDSAQNLYWQALERPVYIADLMREAKWARRPLGVSPATSPRWRGE